MKKKQETGSVAETLQLNFDVEMATNQSIKKVHQHNITNTFQGELKRTNFTTYKKSDPNFKSSKVISFQLHPLLSSDIFDHLCINYQALLVIQKPQTM
uniref:Uncharacterized protein n=1 Tax=Arion vulgaris TaxID=1028688 RepID=A0A0B6ZSA8_9EUPU